jgi:hypothetical protein
MSKRKQIQTEEGKIIETKEQKTVRIVSRRMNKIVNDIKLLKTCVGSKSYSFTPEQSKKIIDVLSNEVTSISAMFDARTDKQVKEEFSL